MNSKTLFSTLLITSFMLSFSQSYESHKYETLFSDDNFEVRNARIIKIKTNKSLKFNLLYDINRSLQKKIKLEQIRKEIS